MDDLLRIVYHFESCKTAYADDVSLSSTHKLVTVAVLNLQTMVSDAKKWLEEVKLSLNVVKTILMIFSRRITPLPDLVLHLDGLDIRPSASARLLGVILDGQLKWMEHIKERESAARKRYFAIRSFVGKT